MDTNIVYKRKGSKHVFPATEGMDENKDMIPLTVEQAVAEGLIGSPTDREDVSETEKLKKEIELLRKELAEAKTEETEQVEEIEESEEVEEVESSPIRETEIIEVEEDEDDESFDEQTDEFIKSLGLGTEE